MAASLNNFQLSSFPVPNTVFSMNNAAMKTFLLTCLLFLASRCQGEDGYEMDEFLKREYSLTKPYQGKLFVLAS